MVLAGLVGQQLLVGAPLDHLTVVKTAISSQNLQEESRWLM